VYTGFCKNTPNLYKAAEQIPVRRLCCIKIFIMAFFSFGLSHYAFAQYSAAAVRSAWDSYNSHFKIADGKGGNYFAFKQNVTNRSSGFWEDAEQIELAEDYFDYTLRSGNIKDRFEIANEINQLCIGFVNKHGLNWASNRFNDDLNWATIAFIRAYKATWDAGMPNISWLRDAEANFNTVYNRASTGNGGLAQIQPPSPMPANWKPNLDAPANFTFVIAGYLIYECNGDINYKKKADGVYKWSVNNLYTTSSHNGGPCVPPNSTLTCGKVIDSNPGKKYTNGTWQNLPNTLRVGPSDFTYNYGIAIKAALLVGGHDNLVIAQNIANYLMFNFNNKVTPANHTVYAGTYNYNGRTWNILPNYGQGGKNNGGYNGIAFRGIGYGISVGALNATTVQWASANVQAAWNNRNNDNLIWNTWIQDSSGKTPDSGSLFSWDCSAALAGLLNIPVALQNLH
jgi:Glycosyl hydrolase family 76.